MNRAFDHCVTKFIQGRNVFQSTTLFNCFPQIDQHDDSSLSGHAEAGNKFHPAATLKSIGGVVQPCHLQCRQPQPRVPQPESGAGPR